jgi:ribosomal protein L11 methyltransferase
LLFPALDVRGANVGLVLAVADDHAPTAADEQGPDAVTLFFNSTARRDDAAAAVKDALPNATVSTREVDDEDWARRSQENLTPITVGAITVTPPWFLTSSSVPHSPTSTLHSPTSTLDSPSSNPPIVIVITPSMGFGTGHHGTTRLCLEALQRVPVAGKRVLDVGTGSGVLAIAAARLGASEVLGIDVDPDAISAARENLEVNPDASAVRLDVVDVRATDLPKSDIVLANLTGAVLVQTAPLLTTAVAAGGVLIVSGLQIHERDEVRAAFPAAAIAWAGEEADWAALVFNFPGPPPV